MMETLPPPPMEHVATVYDSEASARYFFEDGNGKIEVSPLEGGLTASTFLVKVGKEKYVLKFFSPLLQQSEVYRLLWVAQLAGEKSVGPKILDFDVKRRAVLMEFVSGSAPTVIDPEKEAVVDALRKLREMQESVSPKPFGSIYSRVKEAKERGVALTPTMQEALEEVKKLEFFFNTAGQSLTVCHGDFHISNMLFEGEHCTLIDWESSGFGHPYYDVAKLAYPLDLSVGLQLFHLYLGRVATATEKAQFFLMRALVNMAVATNRLLKSIDHPESALVAEELAKRFLDEMRSDEGKR